MSRRRSAIGFGALVALAVMGQASAADPPVSETSYFLGESKMTTPDGKLIRTTLALVKRTVNQADGRIDEHVLTIGEKETKAVVVTLEVKGAKFTLSDPSKSFTGEGELVGEAWKWKEWKSVTTLAGGAGTVTSEDKLTDRGLSVKKSFAGADGKVAVLFDESLAPVGRATYDLLYAKLAPAEKK